jgi:mannose-6-phosphate isomerase-like protein (cupin superfamily)
LDNRHLFEKLHTAKIEAWLEQQSDSISFAKVVNSASWNDRSADIEFYAVFLNYGNHKSVCQRVLICTACDDKTFELAVEDTKEQMANGAVAFAQYGKIANTLAGADFDLAKPIALNSVAIKKPWGQEIWFTGVEKRGVSTLTSSNGISVLLPLLTELLPNTLLAQSRGELILLKILDPLPSPVTGDLYFELHEKKQEVYVVTHVDANAWPNGVGGIRYGFDQAVVASFSDEKQLREAYLAAVEAYERVRRMLDDAIDIKRQQFNYAPDARIANDIFDSWLRTFDPSLVAAERQLRNAMERFIAIKPLRVGDVVKVPLYTPHSLQHGVRTIEFQTPVYERMILSFAQKVLTQSHWDTKQAVDLMDLSEPEELPFERLAGNEGVVVERIVDFDDFEVQRAVIAPGHDFVHELSSRYWLVVGVNGELLMDDSALVNESAILLPRGLNSVCFCNNGITKATLLLATPKVTEDSC